MSNKVKLVLIDLSGTLHVENTAIPGAVEAIKRLRNSHVTLKFVTNTSKESKHVLHNRLIKLGFDIKMDEIFSSLVAAKHIIRHYKINPLLIIDNAALEEFDNLVDFTSPFNAVVIGLAPDKLNYENLNNAFRLLLNGARLIAIHEARYYKSVDGLSLGPGAFIKGLEYSANVKAEVIGKPTSEFFKAALEGY
ncbi:PREDICTED: haloacid dehalogenase-like hydrolase domain-containing protein 2 isoform X2 [Ceratosolen solmsi marchali]|uniref:Haloacid dehalogenase-like hydrolase domain-containing protein 2 n=1 Tax=Ceratosolen solmsi marchali TaxID=326594 RepID=A0AAJ7E027_9HYME|nr:PREDICTED: haloacid dehalogenase-like hydrolase domain-containing protein 2 isoform X2 [Ceratosolen solmsi marchali]